MSNSVSNVEIEDVLSSIRRLVSATPEAPEPPSEGSDKLVLTPAQRVVGRGPAEDPDTDAAEAADEAAPLQTLQTPPSFSEETRAEPEPASTEEADTGDSWVPDDAGSEDKATAATEGAARDDAAEDDDGDEAMPWDDVEVAPEADPSDLEDTIAELEAAVDEAAFTWEPEDDAGAVVAEAATPVVDFTSRRDFTAAPAEADADAGPETEAPAHEAQGATEPGDDRALEDDLSEYLDDAASLDEEGLRTLVAEIVRQELQGTLGERITRNVRKLVRREIHRILASQDFD